MYLFASNGHMFLVILSGIIIKNLYDYSIIMWNNCKIEYICLLSIIVNLIQYTIIKNNFLFCLSFERKS